MTRNLLALSPPTLPDTEPIEYVEAAAAAGYDAVGVRLARSPLFPFHPVVGDAALIRELKRALASSGLTVLDILSFYLQPTTDLDAFAASLELGAGLGARYALVAGDDPEWARLRDNLGRFCDMAARFGVAAAVEPAVIRPLATVSQALRLLSELGRKNAVICLDPLNFVRGGGSAALLRGLDPRLFPYAQISDGVLDPGEPDLTKLGRMSPNQRRMPGEGTLPLRDILDVLPAGLPLSVELPMPKTARLSAREWAQATAESTRRFLDAYYRAKQEAR
ncbi:MAG TPA: sugar phosphate isomerase/epimerase family protein [Candidatus Binatia bacterium]|nr:sugar phosphate isomerase/epimerase family protein [Candidatus Binatia bacterium]